ncbi:helix-turn-helix domain-containing protein [Neobacillus drentensis]|uniref:helix-turn-helix domain-containing protein n=1 Tax=Neobacillus drentensis TaxID=220684 RepID=UPI002FFE3E04
MEFLQPIIDDRETYIAEWQDCYISESKITGFVCTFYLYDKRHHFYGLNDIQDLLKEAKKRSKDVYLSLNAFEYGSRQTKDLKQIRNIGVDIDCYKLNIPVHRALEEIKRLITKGSIPNPNVVIFSGRGLQLLYSISGGASPKMSFLSQYITAQFISELRHLGADTSGTDVTRVFRLPYSVNSRNGKQVTLEIWRTLEYTLLELYSFCKPLEERRKPNKTNKTNKGTLHTLPSKRGLLDIYSLNTARKNDLEALVSLRMGEIEKRNVLTYIYAYTVALIIKNKEATIAFALQLNQRFTDPQKITAVKRTAGNGYDDAMKFFEEFKKRDFKMWYKDRDGIKRPMKSSTIIDELDITPEEMKQFSTIIDGIEKQVRNTSQKRKKRREEGVQDRESYLDDQHSKKESNRQKVVELLEKGHKQTEIAKIIGVSKAWISRLVKELKTK